MLPEVPGPVIWIIALGLTTVAVLNGDGGEQVA